MFNCRLCPGFELETTLLQNKQNKRCTVLHLLLPLKNHSQKDKTMIDSFQYSAHVQTVFLIDKSLQVLQDATLSKSRELIATINNLGRRKINHNRFCNKNFRRCSANTSQLSSLVVWFVFSSFGELVSPVTCSLYFYNGAAINMT